MVKSLIVALSKNPQKCTQTDLQREKKREVCVCSGLGTERLRWAFDRNDLQIREIKSMCGKYTVTFDGWNEKRNFTSLLRFSTLFNYKTCGCHLFDKVVFLFSDKCTFKHLKIPVEVREQPDIYHVLPFWYPYGDFSFLAVLRQDNLSDYASKLFIMNFPIK